LRLSEHESESSLDREIKMHPAPVFEVERPTSRIHAVRRNTMKPRMTKISSTETLCAMAALGFVLLLINPVKSYGQFDCGPGGCEVGATVTLVENASGNLGVGWNAGGSLIGIHNTATGAGGALGTMGSGGNDNTANGYAALYSNWGSNNTG